MFQNRGTRHVKSWVYTLGPFRISRAPLGASVTIFGWGLHVMFLKGKRKISIHRPTKKDGDLKTLFKDVDY